MKTVATQNSAVGNRKHCSKLFVLRPLMKRFDSCGFLVLSRLLLCGPRFHAVYKPESCSVATLAPPTPCSNFQAHPAPPSSRAQPYHAPPPQLGRHPHPSPPSSSALFTCLLLASLLRGRFMRWHALSPQHLSPRPLPTLKSVVSLGNACILRQYVAPICSWRIWSLIGLGPLWLLDTRMR